MATIGDEFGAGRSQRGRKRASRGCRPTPGVAPARAALRAAGIIPQIIKTQHPIRLFREATQLKTVSTVVHAVGVETLRVETQVQITVAVARIDGRGRPAVSIVADVVQHPQFSIARVAEARGVPRGSATRKI